MNHAEQLAQEQTQVAALLNAGLDPQANRTPYLDALEQSKGLHVLRWSIEQWRRFNLLRSCPLTTRALVLQGQLDSVFADFQTQRDMPALIDDLKLAFLDYAAGACSSVVAAVARYEKVLLLSIDDPEGAWELDWPCSPRAALKAVISNAPLPSPSLPPTRFRVTASAPYSFERI